MTDGNQSVGAPLRIAFLDSWLQTSAEGSGTAVGIGGLEGALRRRGHQVERIAPPSTPRWSRLPITLRRLAFNLWLPRWFRPGRYDLVIGFDWDGVWLPRGAPYVCSIKGVIAEELQHERGRIRRLFQLLARLEGQNARRADRVVTTSEYCRRQIAYHYQVPINRIGIVPEGIDVAHWNTALGAAPVQQPSSPTILCVARQYPRKHLADLVRALAPLRRHVPTVRLKLVGDGPEHLSLRQLAAELGVTSNVEFAGSIDDDAVRAAYRNSDIFCLPSVQEGFGIVLLEAMVAGKPIVATTAAAVPEVAQHGNTGILVPPGEPHSLAGALLTLLGSPDLRAGYGAHGRELVEHYDWQRVAERFMLEIAPVLRRQRDNVHLAHTINIKEAVDG